MNLKHFIFFPVLLTLTIFFFCQQTKHPGRQISKNSTIRSIKDSVGFSLTEKQIESVVNLSESLEKTALLTNKQKSGSENWVAGICPHDDHLLAGRVYVHLFQNMRAKRYVIFGVAHKAWKWGVKDSLIFDSFDYWKGPYGPVKVSGLREKIINNLPEANFIVNDEWQSEEHSVEGIVPFIQYYTPDAEIVSILVPYMNWERVQSLSEQLSETLAKIIRQENWQLGEDIAFIFSNDGDHYGDSDWGGRNLAPFGADIKGYLKATAQDSSLIKNNLTGELTAEKLKNFCVRVWDDHDLKKYKIRWCGRFSIPFGLNTVRLLKNKMNIQPLIGYFLRYDNSHNLGKLPLENIGLGTTAPNHLRHWVGYTAIGYR